jgi:hypothetical protein
LDEPHSAGQVSKCIKEGSLMLWTILMIAIVVWMAELGLQFGLNVLPLLLVLAAVVLVMKHMFRRRSFN